MQIIAMPWVFGSQLTAKTRELAPGMHVVLATVYAELPDGRDATLVRLSKPFTQAQLAAALDEAVDRGR
jgi:hypothetical protein